MNTRKYPNGMRKLSKDEDTTFDVMLNGRFVCTLRYKYCPLFPIEIDELVKLVLSKRPTLKGKPFRIAF